MNETLHLTARSTAEEPWSLVITPETAGWGYSALRILDLAPGAEHTFDTGDEEMVVLPLSGSCSVSCDGETFALTGRRSVFTRVSDFAYVPRDASVTVTSTGGGRFAFPSARCDRRLATRYGAADDVQVEVRGAGVSSRQVNNFCSADAFEADKLIAVEVLTPGGNWSSYPPHKHDEAREGESVLEEIYYFELAAPEGLAYQRVYGTPGRPIDVLAEVRTGDVVLVPHGWHGPSVAAPGYHLYYLNVMAGPGATREWLISDDPAHAWVRDEWASLEPDPRLPMGRPGRPDRTTEDER